MSLLDAFLPDYDVHSRHEIQIESDAGRVHTALLTADFSDSAVVRALMRLRRFGRPIERPSKNASLQENLRRAGFVLLAHDPPRHLVAGIAGQFWRPSSGIHSDLLTADFISFRRHGYAKAVWMFELVPLGAKRTLLRTETRVQCFGRTAELRFRAYWFLVGPFSGLIRRSILKLVKERSENTVNIEL